MNVFEQVIDLGDGRTVTIETGKLAKQAHGSVVVKSGETMLLATIVADHKAGENVDFLPLMVDYKEKFAAAGKFPGGFLKREGRPNDNEVLICRLVDRALRPLFPSDFHASTIAQIIMISSDGETMPDSLACLAASAAIACSDIPFNGPVSEVRVARINGNFVVNPSYSDLEGADMDMIIAGTIENIMMVEGELNECSEADMLEAIKVGHIAIKVQCEAQLELASKVAKAQTKREYNHEDSDEALFEAIKAACYDKCYAVAKEGNPNKEVRKAGFGEVKAEFVATLSEEDAAKSFLIGHYFHEVEKDAVRNCVLDTRKRLDGRDLDEIRPIWSEVDYLPSCHGSSIFTRGETQSLTSVTLGGKMDQQLIDGAFISGTEKFVLHYNFPSFSTGEARPNRGVSRREVGHGNLALRALKPMVPADSDQPYTVRIVSEILESNGSSSMATVCAGTLALMDAGVAMKKPVSGIAMGLIADKNDSSRYAVLSDILGDEDHLGDMDFKICGTKDGITACQMDIKVDGLSYEILEQALEQAKKGRLHILGEMAKTITEPRKDYKENVPRIVQLKIQKDFIGAIIGPGGKVIQEMQKETNTTITIEEIDEAGIVSIMSVDKAGLDAAVDKIKAITFVPEVGDTYKGTIKSVVSFGAFVEFLPGKQGLLHVSEIAWNRIENVEDVLKEGEEIEIKLIDIDKKSGKFKLSRKVLLERPQREPAKSAE